MGRWFGQVQPTPAYGRQSPPEGPYIAVLSDQRPIPDKTKRAYIIALGDGEPYNSAELPELYVVSNAIDAARPRPRSRDVDEPDRAALRSISKLVVLDPDPSLGLPQLSYIEGEPNTLTVGGAPTMARVMCEATEAVARFDYPA
jgi:hypothetical protein